MAVASKEPPASKSVHPPENLHIAAIQRIVGKHRNNMRMPLATVRYWIEKAADDQGGTMESKDLERIRNQLRRDLGMEIGEVVQLVQRWPAR